MFKPIRVWIRKQSVIWISTTLLAILTVFTQTITDRIKTGLNHADQREKFFEKMSTDLSAYAFNAESILDNYTEALNSTGDKTIGAKFLDGIVNDYNGSITTIHKNEYAYWYQIRTYCRRKWLFFRDDAPEKYDTLVASIYRLDTAIHSLNPIAKKIAPQVKKDSLYVLTPADTVYLQTDLPGVLRCLEAVKTNTSELVKAF